MKHFFFSVLTFCFSYSSWAQWTALNSTTTNDLHSVDFINENFGMAAGDAGTILKTTDGGANWTNLNFIGPDNFHDILLQGEDTIFVSGLGVIGPVTYRSTDAGVTWQKVLIDNSRIYICDSPDGDLFAAADYVYHSVDGGENWDQPYTVSGTVTAFSIQAVNDQTIHMGANVAGIVTYSAIVARSANGGATFWDFDVFSFPNANALTAFSFIDSDTGYLFMNDFDTFNPNDSSQLIRVYNFQLVPSIGNDSLWVFSYQSLDLLFPDYVSDCKFFSDHTGYAVGPKGIVYRSTDGGFTWVNDFTGSNELFALDMLDETTGYAVGTAGTILKRGTATQVTNDELKLDDLKLFPNPSHELANISFSLERASHTQVFISDITGKVVQEIAEENLPAGSHVLSFPTSELPAGLYTITVLSGEEIARVKLTTMR